MSEAPGTPVENQSVVPSDRTVQKRAELEIARKEYFVALEAVQQCQKELNEARETFGTQVDRENSLVETRDHLNAEIRDKRKEIRQIELSLENAKEELGELENLVSDVRKEVPKAKRFVEQAYRLHESAQNRLTEAQASMELATQKVKDAEAAFLAVGGNLPQKETLTDKELATNNRQSPWVSGSFYIFAVIIVMTVIAVISKSTPWYSLVIVLIGGLLAVVIVGAFQLRNDEALSEENFIDLMERSLKRLPLLRGSDKFEQQAIMEDQPAEVTED
jgi:VIT1/CCC1 family predicted Fe2+/Mn2+ transporter